VQQRANGQVAGDVSNGSFLGRLWYGVDDYHAQSQVEVEVAPTHRTV
jgi:hypothetical protein